VTVLDALNLRSEPPALGDVIARPRGDHEGQEHPFSAVDEASAKAAAVLVPIISRKDGASVLLTMRAAGLNRHAGQVAFPGGRIDATDASPLAAALRETHEEVGIAPEFIRPLGFLDAYLTGTGYRIVPVVAEILPGFALTLNPDEVEETFETPLSFLMDPANIRREGRKWNGVFRSYYAFEHGGRYIWGATAGIIRNLQNRLIDRTEYAKP
jgi:8-oxo-dGTP pyrophosphatase MutT (NUDIX family)